mgnify:CR=1 FL=1
MCLSSTIWSPFVLQFNFLYVYCQKIVFCFVDSFNDICGWMLLKGRPQSRWFIIGIFLRMEIRFFYHIEFTKSRWDGNTDNVDILERILADLILHSWQTLQIMLFWTGILSDMYTWIRAAKHLCHPRCKCILLVNNAVSRRATEFCTESHRREGFDLGQYYWSN